MLNIEPIKLLSGSHGDTAQTGSGCFMNVIAYLNGEPQITDESPCVCRSIRKPAIWINDFLNDSERHLLLPFVQRAMGTATDDEVVLRQRSEVVLEYIRDLTALADRFKPNRSAAGSAALSLHLAEMAMSYSNAPSKSVALMGQLAANAADYAARVSNGAADRKALVDRSLAFMDSVCPAADTPSRLLIERANRLLELATTRVE
ncbi:hypothetical protein [Paraburkholderia nemoris]|uniref:hypothetical protein n=1 Tax=Paraburkholderia nemoris TaxID=2793076 RepID=UPI001B03BAE7|nr:hypothetical protein [Paraburkholderia nemoris]CAE6839163.1 hypothetical protein R75777_06984 [Paraburkholderia nemoris]